MKSKEDLELEMMILERKYARGRISREEYLYNKSELLGQRVKALKHAPRKRAPEPVIETTDRRAGLLTLFSLFIISLSTYIYCCFIDL